ncbi:alpha-acetolactate decarboxylase [Enterococcus sp. 8G7_MSG3316]|uniref:Alpha-acetolactate decarboxylase n=1 Tax=Candidatus Enterococcus testudinis TaxID=1834191 RepID=A0A242A293_9ENTE|nr:acetolactate decarboxylase [Enterococcus sp. 8G7_MSG3316]OTN75156.1 alpha-acetolactate decarboxylase [Enterococcus sp. 8G7_MSG3316]
MNVTSKSYLYQHGTLGGLMQDLMEGTEQIGRLLAEGDTGIGTLAGSDGEVIILDGRIYHVDQTGDVRQLTGTEKTPYAAVTRFAANKHVSIYTETSSERVKEAILAQVSPNLFTAVKMRGVFSHMHVRVAPKQTKPYPKFVDIIDNQPEYQADDIAGTIVGFFTPQLFHGAAAAGFHWHFLSDDHCFAGHVLAFDLAAGEIELMELAEFRQHFPIDDADFLQREIDVAGIAKDIQVAE